MTTHRPFLTARHPRLGLALFALGLAAAASTAQAQTERGATPTTPPPMDAPATANPVPNSTSTSNAVSGVTIDAPTRRPGVREVPPEKAAAYDAQVAKDEAFRKYRDSTPPLSADPNDQSKDFPGLKSYIPK